MAYKLEGLAVDIFNGKYREENDHTVEGMWRRVANAIAIVEKPEDRVKWADIFYELLMDFGFIPGGRISAGAGTNNNFLLNCAVLPIGDSIDEIYEAVKKAAVLAKCQYGSGFSFSAIRPKDAKVSKGGSATGPVSFIKVFDASGAVIETGGGRRAAAMAVLRVDHPNIVDFIMAKREKDVLTQFNISVGITFKFLQAVKDNADFDLVFEGKVYETVNAKELWDKICMSGYLYNDPGILMIDQVNKYNNGYYLYLIEATNPCLHPDSMIETVEGRVRIADIKEPTMVYTMLKDGSLGIRKASASWISKTNASTIKISVKSGKAVTCTPDHLIFVKDIGWIKAEDLRVGDCLVQLCRARRGAAYSGVKLTTEHNRAYRMEHRMIAEAVYGPLQDWQDVHHIDGNTYNNTIDNFEVMDHEEHCEYTATFDHPQLHQVQDADGRFVSTGVSDKRIIPMPENLKSNMKNNFGSCVTKIEEGPTTDVYDLSVEDTHNFISDFIVVHNCGELPLPPFGVCDLGNHNVTKFVKNPFKVMTNIYDNFDWEGYAAAVRVGVRFLDNVLDVSEYPYPEMAERAHGDRRIGLNGVAGLGSALAMLRLPYDSLEGIVFAESIQKACTYAAYEASIELAREKGSFPNFNKEKYLEAEFIKTLPASIREGIAEHGIRNIALLTIPPVGTGSLLAGNISNGLEPIFALEYNRKVRQPDQSSKDEAVEDYAWGLFKKTEEYNPACSPPEFFKTSREISIRNHIDMQATLQRYIDGSISKTVNMPESTTFDEYKESLWYSIESGCKGFTSFREGTREGVLSTKEEEKKPAAAKVAEEKIKAAEPKKKRPRNLKGSTYKVADDKGNLYITINNIEEKGKTRPFEIFINSNGANSDNAVFYKAMGKMMSAVMRRTDDCRFLVKDLQSIYGASGFFSDGRYNQSQPQMIGNILEEHYRSLDPVAAKEIKYGKCPECGEMTYLKEGGCGKCLSCGHSSCG